jgi:Contractile injection system tube protein
MAESEGQLAKLRIVAYNDERFEEPADAGEYVAQINPEKVGFKYQIELEEQQAQGTSGAQPRFGRTKPEELTFQFLFDATGAVPLPGGVSAIDPDGVHARVEAFKRVVLQYNGEEHKPNNLKLIWGKLLFKCVLSELNLEYTLFRADGTPLRASATAKFVGYVEDELRLAEERNQSPDVTHQRVIRSGDTLQQLVVAIYRDPALYLEVARANRLVNFRRLTAGQTLLFPPVDKTHA